MSSGRVEGTHHVVRVQGADVIRCLANPVRENGCCAAVAARFVRQLPRKYRVGVSVPAHDCFDVVLVHGLALRGGVPLRVAAHATGREVRCHATKVGPVVYEVD